VLCGSTDYISPFSYPVQAYNGGTPTHTKKLWSNVRAAPGTNGRVVNLGAKYGPQFDDLDAINTHFADIPTDPDYNIDDINAIIEYVHSNVPIRTHSVHEYEICKLLICIKRTAPGADNIPYWVIKYCVVELASVVTNLVSKTFSTAK